MHDDVMRARAFDGDGPHEPAARLFAIPWIDIDVFAPQALRTMIGIAAPLHGSAAVLADEILLPFDECHAAIVQEAAPSS